jgi:tRNA dimethylallyltransferase
MDIGSAKPTIAERQGVAHWGFDLVEPNERFTAADFKRYAEQKVNEIQARGHVPIVVGGTGLYVDSLVFDYEFPTKIDPERRSSWERLGLEELYKYCSENNIELPENKQNKRYVINTIMRHGHDLKMRKTPLANILVVGIATDRDALRKQILNRTRHFFASGVIEEGVSLAAKYGWDCEAMTGNIYPLIRKHLEGGIELSELERLYAIKDWHLAKRQLTWFKRNEYITWLTLNDAYTYLTHALD